MSSSSLPRTTKALTLQQRSNTKPTARKGGEVYDDAVLVERPLPQKLEEGQVLVRIGAVGFNHREVWIRKRRYPGIVNGSVFGADGAGMVVASGVSNDPFVNKRVFLTPSRGWDKDPIAPESTFGILGNGANPAIGTFSEYVVVERDQIIRTPDHLTDIQAAAWPLGGLTAWRATMINGQVAPGQNVLITGIGGGVALLAMQLCIAKEATVYVTSGSGEKIRRAVGMGARGGVSYRESDWGKKLEGLLKGQLVDVVIDSGGGDVMGKVSRMLKPGGRVVVYGMTAAPTITFTMREVLKNHKLLGSTMGSKQDLIDATEFMEKKRIVPCVGSVIQGLENAEKGFEMLGRGEQFGKVVIDVRGSTDGRAKL